MANRDPSDRTQQMGFSPVPADPPELVGVKADYDRDLGQRRGLLAQVAAIEKRWGIDATRCKHCGKPTR